MYSGTKKSYKNPIEFLHIESKINTYIRKKNDFSPEQAFLTLNLGNISESLTTEMTTWVVPSIDNLTLVANPSGVWTANDVTVVASYSKRNFQYDNCR